MLSIDLFGRLGNNLFQYAMVRTIAERRGFNFWIDPQGWITHDLFNLYFGKYDGNIQRIYSENGTQFDKKVFNVPDYTGFSGFFQSEKYFDHDKVRQWYKPLPIVSLDYDNTCYIHFRGGDYNVFPWNTYQLNQGYYDEAMALIHQKNHNLRFAVVTDDKNEALKRFPNFEIISNSIERDFVTLMSAKYLIISNSSFSWWAAWLNIDNVVIAPSGWFQYNFNKGAFEPQGIYTEKFIWI